MHSGVFAASPDAAGAAAAAYLRAPGPDALRDAEIADVDEEAARDDRVASRLYGAVRVPRQPRLMIARKAVLRDRRRRWRRWPRRRADDLRRSS